MIKNLKEQLKSKQTELEDAKIKHSSEIEMLQVLNKNFEQQVNQVFIE